MSTQNRHFVYAIISLHTEKTAELNVCVNDQLVVILSPSGDRDVIVMAFVHHSTERVIIDNGNSESRRMIVCDQTIDNEQRSEMIGFHSLSGYDYTSSFFSKEKRLLGKKPV